MQLTAPCAHCHIPDSLGVLLVYVGSPWVLVGTTIPEKAQKSANSYFTRFKRLVERTLRPRKCSSDIRRCSCRSQFASGAGTTYGHRFRAQPWQYGLFESTSLVSIGISSVIRQISMVYLEWCGHEQLLEACRRDQCQKLQGLFGQNFRTPAFFMPTLLLTCCRRDSTAQIKFRANLPNKHRSHWVGSQKRTNTVFSVEKNWIEDRTGRAHGHTPQMEMSCDSPPLLCTARIIPFPSARCGNFPDEQPSAVWLKQRQY